MKSFEFVQPATLQDALEALARGDDALAIAGGTDLLGTMKRGIVSPARLVNLKALEGLSGFVRNADGSLTIGALACLSEVQNHREVRRHHRLLEQAIRRTASPQIRNRATLGGSLCQRPRCLYYRHALFQCLRKGGAACYAARGNKRHYVVFGSGRCAAAHPSDTAPALVALGARVRIEGPGGARTLPLSDVFSSAADREEPGLLGRAEVLTHVQIPPPLPKVREVFLKAAERRAVDFALVSLAAWAVFRKDRIDTVRLVLGGAASRPWRLQRVEGFVTGRELSEETVQRAADMAVEGALPVSRANGKVRLIRGLIRKALFRLSAPTMHVQL